MYRSPSTSSVFWEPVIPVRQDSGYSVEASGSDKLANHRNEVFFDSSFGIQRASTSRAGDNQPQTKRISSTKLPEDESLAMNTLSSALTGSKMATNPDIPTITGNRPLPKALLPKAARTTAASIYQPVIVSSFGQNPARRNSISGPTGPLPSTKATISWTYQREGMARAEPPRSESRIKRMSVNESPSKLSSSRSPIPFFGSSTLGRVPVIGSPMPRRQPIVEDSIYPMLRAALGKDNNDAEDLKVEDTINRQVFGRGSRSRINSHIPSSSSSSSCDFGPFSSSHPVRQSCSDDVFTQSHLSHQQLPPDATIRRNNMKSFSEILPSRTFIGSTTPWRQSTGLTAGDMVASSERKTEVNREETRQTERFSYPVKFTQSRRTSLPPPPKERPPPPPTEQSVLRSSEDIWYDPIPVQPRKIIQQPRARSQSSQSLLTTQISRKHEKVLFGETVLPASYPLLEKVGRNITYSDSEAGERDAEEIIHSRLNGNGSTEISSKCATRNCVTDSEMIPQENMHQEPENLLIPAYSGDGTTLSFTSFANPSIPISHQTMDSFNTEDSGVERWDPKEGNDQSADELMDSFQASVEEERTSKRAERGNIWREDLSEGRGSLSSSPHSHNSHNTDDHWSSILNSNTERHLLVQQQTENDHRKSDEDTSCSLPSRSILHQLLAENRLQIARKSDDQVTSSIQENDLLDEASCLERGNSKVLEVSNGANYGQCLDFDSQSNISLEGIDSDSSRTLSTTVQSAVTASGDTVGEPCEQSRSTDENKHQWTSSTSNYRREALHGSAEAFDLGPIDVTDEKEKVNDAEGKLVIINISKGPVGVGFSIEGGKGSLTGDRPIVVKRLFQGEMSNATCNLQPGDELISINEQKISGLSHYEAWKCIKALPVGNVQLVIRRSVV